MATKQLRQELIDNYGIDQTTGEMRFFGDGGDDSCKLVIIDDLPAFVRNVGGVDQLTGLNVAATSLRLGQNVSVAAAGDSIITRFDDGTIGNLFAQTQFSISGGDTGPTTVLRLFDFQAREVTQSDNSGTFTGGLFEYNFIADKNQLITKFYFQTGATAATDVFTVEVHRSLDDSGPLIFRKEFPASFLPADTEIEFLLDGFFEYSIGDPLFARISSAGVFSLKTDAAVTNLWRAIDYFNTETENILTICEFTDGTNYSRGDWLIDPDTKKIYVCNIDGVQSGTFAANIDKWDALASSETVARNQTTGLLEGGIISAASSTTVDWTSGHGVVVDYSDPENPLINDVRWSAVTGYTPTNIATDGTTLFGYDASGVLVEILSTDIILGNAKDYIFFGSVNHVGGTIFSILTSPGNVGYRSGEAFNDFINLVIGPANVSGNIYGPNGANLSIDVVGGSAFVIGSNFRINPKLCDIVNLPSQAALTFSKVYRAADPSESIVSEGAPTTFIDPTKWDDGSGTLQTVTAGYWTIQRIFRSRAGITFVAYGQQEFASLALALEALGSESFEEKNPLEFMLFRASLVVAENATDLSNIAQAEFFEQASFRVFGAQSASSTIPGVTVPGGNSGDIQFNDGGTFGGSDAFRYTESAGFPTVNLQSQSATTGGGMLAIDNSSSFQRLYLSYIESTNNSLLEAVTNNLSIIAQDTLNLSYAASSVVLEDSTGNNLISLNSSASDKDVNFSIKDHLGNPAFEVEHNDVSGQTSVAINNDAGTPKFNLAFNQTLDNIFFETTSGCDLYLISNDLLFIQSGDNINVQAQGNFPIRVFNNEAEFAVRNATNNYSFLFTNTQANTSPLLVLQKTGTNGGTSQIFTSTTAPEGVITGNGGDLCLVDAGTSSELYIKLIDTGNTGWQKLLHGTSGVQGPGTTFDNAIATWSGTDGLTLQNSYGFLSSDANSTILALNNVTASGQSSFRIRNNASADRFTIVYNQALGDVFLTTGVGTDLYHISSGSLTLESNSTMLIETLGDHAISMKNDNAIFNINSSGASYSFGFSNQEPSTDPLFIWAKDAISGGVCRVYLRNVTPEGAITASGGSLCIRSSGTSSNIYLKLEDATNTGWQSILGDVLGPATSTDTAISTWNGTNGTNLNDSYAFLSSDANNTILAIDNVSISGQSGLHIRTNAGATRYSLIYNQALEDIFIGTSIGVDYYVNSGGDIFFEAASNVYLETTGNHNVTINNDNATFLVHNSAQNYRFDVTNNQPSTNPLIRYTQTGTNGGTSDFYFSTVSPEGVILANGGALCIVDAGTDSDIYLKRTDASTTGWVELLHGTSGVQGPLTSTDNAIAVWDGTTGLLLQDSYSSLLSDSNSTILSVKNISASGQSGFTIQNSFGLDRYSLTYDQVANSVFMTTNSGTSYSNVVDGSLEHLSNSNVAIGSFGNQTVEFYNTNATLRVDTSANGGRLFFSNITADTAEMIRLFKTGTNGGAAEIYLTSRTPTGNITGNGGDLAIRDAGTSSNLYLKRVDGGTTGWGVVITSAVETSTLNAMPAFDVTTGNSLSPVNTATVSADTSTTTLQLRPVTSAGNAEIDFRTSSGLIRTQFYYDEDVNTTNLEANTAKLNIGNFGGPIAFSSTSGDSDLYIRTSSPSGSLVGNYGDLAIDISSNPSMYLNTGDARIWSRFSLDSDTDMYGGPGRLQNMLMWSEDLSNAKWIKSGTVVPTITPNYATAPNGETTANRVQFTGGPGVAGLIRQLLTFTASQNYTFSIWIKHVSGGDSFQVDFGDGATYTITASPEWQRYIINGVAGNANWFDIQDFGAAEYLFWGLQINDGTEAYPYLKTEDLAKTDVDEYGLSVDGKIIFDKADTDNLVTNLGTGVCCGGLLSINGGDNTLLDVTAGNALIADYSIPGEPFIRAISWDAQTIDPNLTTAWNKWVGVQESATAGVGEFIFDTEFTQLEKRTVAIVGRCWTGNTGTGVITGVGQYTTPAFGQAYTANDLSYVFGSINKYGNTYSANGANLLLNKSAGLTYRFGAGWASTPESPNVHIDAAQTAISAYYYILSGSTSATIETDIDPDNYDNGGTKTAVPAGKFTLQRLYYFPVSQVCMVTYGQTLYSSMAEAIGAAGQDVVDVEEALIDGSVLRGWLAVEQGTTDLSNISNALFKEARSVSEPAAKGTTGTNYTLKSYALADVGSEDTSYAAGFYDYSSTSVTLSIGGTVTQTFGSANRMSGAHAFVVASGPGSTDLVLTVSGASINDAGVLNSSDSEIIVPDTDQATTNQYFETSKKWVGQITYTLTGASGSFTFNYGFAKYEDFGNRDFTVQDFEFVGKAAANSTNNLIVLLHHSPVGWTYAATGFKPFPTVIASNVNDLSTFRDFTVNTHFAYKRANLSYFVEGSALEGVIIEYDQSTNNPIYYANLHVGVLI